MTPKAIFRSLTINFALFKLNDKDTEFMIPLEDRPYSINGYFYHNHTNDKKYHRDPDGGWKKQGSHADPSKRKRGPPLPRIRNGKIWPVSARKTHTIEEILAAQEARRKDSPWLEKPKKSCSTKKKKKTEFLPYGRVLY